MLTNQLLEYYIKNCSISQKIAGISKKKLALSCKSQGYIVNGLETSFTQKISCIARFLSSLVKMFCSMQRGEQSWIWSSNVLISAFSLILFEKLKKYH